MSCWYCDDRDTLEDAYQQALALMVFLRHALAERQYEEKKGPRVGQQAMYNTPVLKPSRSNLYDLDDYNRTPPVTTGGTTHNNNTTKEK